MGAFIIQPAEKQPGSFLRRGGGTAQTECGHPTYGPERSTCQVARFVEPCQRHCLLSRRDNDTPLAAPVILCPVSTKDFLSQRCCPWWSMTTKGLTCKWVVPYPCCFPFHHYIIKYQGLYMVRRIESQLHLGSWGLEMTGVPVT